MIFRPSAAICKKQNEIPELRRGTDEPGELTKNGEDALMVMDIASFTRRVMDIASFTRRVAMLQFREDLFASEQECMNGAKPSWMHIQDGFSVRIEWLYLPLI